MSNQNTKQYELQLYKTKQYEIRFISKHFVLYFALSSKVSISISDLRTHSSEFWSSDSTFSCNFATESTQHKKKLYQGMQ